MSPLDPSGTVGIIVELPGWDIEGELNMQGGDDVDVDGDSLLNEIFFWFNTCGINLAGAFIAIFNALNLSLVDNL